MTTIDEARKVTDEAKEDLQAFLDYPVMFLDGDGVAHPLAPDPDAIRTLLAHTADYDALKGRLEEAVRLMGPFVREGENYGAHVPGDARLMITSVLLVGDLRALAAFLDREKEAGRAERFVPDRFVIEPRDLP